MVLQSFIKKPHIKPRYPNFSCGPTNKLPGWNLSSLKTINLSRYHRSKRVKIYINTVIQKLRYVLKIPKSYKIMITPGSCTGAMESVIWSLFTKKKKITNIIYDYWGQQWASEINKLGLNQNILKSLNGTMPSLERISLDDDLIFVWTGTSTGMSIDNCKWIKNNNDRIVVCDATSAAFIYHLEWDKLDATVFSWQKALGSEAQHGIVVLSPKAQERLKSQKKKNIPKTLNLNMKDALINTPSLLCFTDFDFALDWFKKSGGVDWSYKYCKGNKKLLDMWIKENNYLSYFCNKTKFQSISPCYFRLNNTESSKKLKKIILFLEKEKIAYDIESYRKAAFGIRIWNGPTILKNDLTILTNWLDWSFENIT